MAGTRAIASRLRTAACLPLLLGAAVLPARAGPSQTRLEDDCMQRLRPIVPREVKARRVDFSALGTYAGYYVVTHGFDGELATGQRTAACTYRRDGQWVKDDAAVFKLKQELDSARRR